MAFEIKMYLEVMKVYMNAQETTLWCWKRRKQFKRGCLIRVMEKKKRGSREESERVKEERSVR